MTEEDKIIQSEKIIAALGKAIESGGGLKRYRMPDGTEREFHSLSQLLDARDREEAKLKILKAGRYRLKSRRVEYTD